MGPFAPGADESYEIGAGDVLQVIVLGQDAMSGEFAVDANGLMRFPFLGNVKASGMSAPELERKLTTLLSDGYLKRPQVSVAVKHYRSQRVYVTGEIASRTAQINTLPGLLPELGLVIPVGAEKVLPQVRALI